VDAVAMPAAVQLESGGEVQSLVVQFGHVVIAVRLRGAAGCVEEAARMRIRGPDVANWREPFHDVLRRIDDVSTTPCPMLRKMALKR
jgi:hypothetical protein